MGMNGMNSKAVQKIIRFIIIILGFNQVTMETGIVCSGIVLQFFRFLSCLLFFRLGIQEIEGEFARHME